MAGLPSPRDPRSIALRHLSALGLSARPASGGRIEGELPALVRHPIGGRPIERIRFSVEGPDALRPLGPALVEGLAPIAFLDAVRPEQLARTFEHRLRERLDAARRALREMQRLRLQAAIDGERLRAVGRLPIEAVGEVILEGDERGVRAVRVEPAHGGESAALDLSLDLGQFADRIDLELHLAAAAERALGDRGLAPPVLPGPDENGGVTFGWLVDRLGADARIGPDLSIVRDFALHGEPLRFEATREVHGRGWRAMLRAGDRIVWKDRFELGTLERLESIAARALGLEPPAPAASPITLGPARAFAGDAVADQMVPVAGEVWVMGLLVEKQSDQEIRFVLVDVDGKPFGPARTLAPADFHATFERAGAGYRLPARVLRVADGRVEWVQLDPARSPVGSVKSGALAMFVHHFLPEAAVY